jgi:ubiquinone biosynthesis protein Coq4
MRVAVTTAHMAFVRPGLIVDAMDAFVDGWSFGRSASNLNFERWEDELDTPLEVLRARMKLNRVRIAA